jgi:hypothetical protein
MDKDKFWLIIDNARQEAGHWRDMLVPLQERLCKLDAQEITRWQMILDGYMDLSFKEKLWGAADIMAGGPCFENDFENFRRWLIAQGKKAFMDALSDPGSLAYLKAVQELSREAPGTESALPGGRRKPAGFEGLQYAAVHAYESKPGEGDFYGALDDTDMAEWEYAGISREICFAKDIDIEPGGPNAPPYERMAALRKSFPELYAMFNDISATVIQNYDFTYSIRIGGTNVILAENKAADMPYLVCERNWNNPLGADEFKNALAGDNFLEMMRLFADRVSGRVAALEEERSARGIPFETLSAADCVPDGLASDMEGKVCVLKPEKLAPEYRGIDYQLVLVTGGFGTSPAARGHKVFCTDLYTGKQESFRRDAIAGVFPEDRLPDWAREKLTALRTERKSVLDQLRKGKKEIPPREAKQKKQKKDGPER